MCVINDGLANFMSHDIARFSYMKRSPITQQVFDNFKVTICTDSLLFEIVGNSWIIMVQ